jgi:protein phosphatase
MERYKILYSCISHQGYFRKNNEDNFACEDTYMDWQQEKPVTQISAEVSNNQPHLFGVFDGIGGEAYGEVASLLAAKSLAACKPGQDGVADLLKANKDANEKIGEYARAHQIERMGSTSAMIGFYEDHIALCNVGDSKIFRYSHQKLQQISLDHLISVPPGCKAPLSQYLGMNLQNMPLMPHLAKGKYHNDDFFLICSDGLSDMLSLKELHDLIEQTPFEKLSSRLLDQALQNGGYDNVTLIVFKVLKSKRTHHIFKK